MSLRLMKERMKISGMNVRDEEIRDAIFIEEVENKNDVSYCPTFYKVTSHSNYNDKKNYEQIHARLYNRKWSSYDVHTMKMKTLIKEPVTYGDLFYNQKDNTYWLCMQTDCVDEIDYISKLVQCNCHMYWQKNDGTIISRYVWVENASAYNNGEEGNNTITLQSNQFMVYIPFDDDVAELDNGKRIHISRSNTKCRPYELTRPDDVSYNYGDGILNIIFTQTQYNPDKDKLVTLEDGTQAWICDYIPISSPTPPTSNPNKTADLSAEITFKGDLQCGYWNVYTVNFTDKNGNAVDWNTANFTWNVVSTCGIENDIERYEQDNKIRLKIDDDTYVGEKFTLQCVIGESVVGSVDIKVVEGL